MLGLTGTDSTHPHHRPPLCPAGGPPVHRMTAHAAAVKALAWCPFQSNLLASGGGTADRCIKFWNTHTGALLNSIDTGSQVLQLSSTQPTCPMLQAEGTEAGNAAGTAERGQKQRVKGCSSA